MQPSTLAALRGSAWPKRGWNRVGNIHQRQHAGQRTSHPAALSCSGRSERRRRRCAMRRRRRTRPGQRPIRAARRGRTIRGRRRPARPVPAPAAAATLSRRIRRHGRRDGVAGAVSRCRRAAVAWNPSRRPRAGCRRRPRCACRAGSGSTLPRACAGRWPRASARDGSASPASAWRVPMRCTMCQPASDLNGCGDLSVLQRCDLGTEFRPVGVGVNQPRSPPLAALLASSELAPATVAKSAPPARRARTVSILALACASLMPSPVRTRMWRAWYCVTICGGALLASRVSTSLSSWKPLGPRVGPMIWPTCMPADRAGESARDFVQAAPAQVAAFQRVVAVRIANRRRGEIHARPCRSAP